MAANMSYFVGSLIDLEPCLTSYCYPYPCSP